MLSRPPPDAPEWSLRSFWVPSAKVSLAITLPTAFQCHTHRRKPSKQLHLLVLCGALPRWVIDAYYLLLSLVWHNLSILKWQKTRGFKKKNMPRSALREMKHSAVLCRMLSHRGSNWALAHFVLALPQLLCQRILSEGLLLQPQNCIWGRLFEQSACRDKWQGWGEVLLVCTFCPRASGCVRLLLWKSNFKKKWY